MTEETIHELLKVEPALLDRTIQLVRRAGEDRGALYREADATRAEHMGRAVPVRGIIEFSNVCANDCAYCGIRRSNADVPRYTLDEDEVMAVARRMEGWGQMTVVLQSGEAPSDRRDRELGEIIRRIKRETPLAVTVSSGNRPRETYAHWRACGMDRYLLRFETSDPDMFARIHPDATLEDRLRCLLDLRSLGVQIGSGFMIGLPGETHERLARNILLCRALDLDMIGIGPFIPSPGTPMSEERNAWADDPDMFFVALAALRIMNPKSHIPATTAFDAVFPGVGRNLALCRGANVFMPNSTPGKYRASYQLYPGKPCLDEDAGDCATCVQLRIRSIGRTVGVGPGHSIRKSNPE
ncbi:MAG: [FeFe] hydrogenase H-cluster radical SAM maturase HydE [Kiritimatiellae bacterium]|nr:[FeFe] hydrogenase H-cluster radical SAM maturase HydE [Kiritimatiellia bacterium]